MAEVAALGRAYRTWELRRWGDWGMVRGRMSGKMDSRNMSSAGEGR